MNSARGQYAPQRNAQKRKMAVLRLKVHFSQRKSATKFLYVKTASDKVATHSNECVAICPNSIVLEANYITMVEYNIAYYVCRISFTTFGQSWYTLQRGLSAIAELFVHYKWRILVHLAVFKVHKANFTFINLFIMYQRHTNTKMKEKRKTYNQRKSHKVHNHHSYTK